VFVLFFFLRMSSAAAVAGRAMSSKGRNVNKKFKSMPGSRHASDHSSVYRYRTSRDFWTDEEAAVGVRGDANASDDDYYEGDQRGVLAAPTMSLRASN
jgi:hypothetical protein